MDESSQESSGERKAQHPEAAQSPADQSAESPAIEGQSSGSKLPVVWSPRLDAGEEIADEAHSDAEPSPSEDEAERPSAAAGTPAQTSRFALLAASVAIAAALGSFVGSLSASGVAHLWPAAVAKPGLADAGMAQAVKAELAELSALKANLDGAARATNGQFAKLADRLDHVERAQAEPAAKIAHIADALDRLEKRTIAAAAAPETTGSIASNPPPAATEAKQADKILRDWVVQDVRGGRALVESRFGAVFTVTAGSVLPGLGRVETIKKQDSEWIVVTERGTITSTGQ